MQKNHKIANIIEEGKVGGPQIRMITIASAISKHIDTQIIMPSDNSKEFQSRCDDANIPYVIMPISRITKEWKAALKYIFFSPFEIIKLTRYLKRGNFDIVHISGGSWQYKGVIAGKLAGNKILWHLNDAHIPLFFRKIFQMLSPLADGYIYSAERSKSYYSPFTKKTKPYFIISPSVDTKHFDPNVSYHGDDELKEKWIGKIVIGAVANINPMKGLELLVKAAKILDGKKHEIIFVIIGPIYNAQQKYFQKLQNTCDLYSVENVCFLGSRRDVRSLLQRIDIFVCPSLSETGPMSLFEAMSMEKPIVSTNVGDVKKYIINGKNGFIVNIDDEQALCQKLNLLIKNKKMRINLGKEARQTVINNFDIEICSQLHIDAYNYMQILPKK